MALMIKSLFDFEAGTPAELSFPEGAIMTVLESTNPDWYHADYEGYSGMVPRNYFEEFYAPAAQAAASEPERGRAMSLDGDANGDEWDDFSASGRPASIDSGDSGGGVAVASAKPKVMIAKLLYNYDAQQPDELTVAQGESIQIIDDSDPDWYMAKPIARLGESGLVPKNYCEIDVDTKVSKKKPGLFSSSKSSSKLVESDDDKRRKSEEKEREAERKRLEKEEAEKRKAEDKAQKEKQKEEERLQRERLREEERVEREKRKELQRIDREQYVQERAKLREEELKKRAEEERIAKERELAENEKSRQLVNAEEIREARVSYFEKRKDGKYYFTVRLARPVGDNSVYRTYQDFYDFHIKLMELFPEEAGEGGRERTIPYLPGQVLFVTEAVSAQRRGDLDIYCQGLIVLPAKVSKSKFVVDFFATRSGDEAVGAGKEVAPWSIGGSRSTANLSTATKPSSSTAPPAPPSDDKPLERTKKPSTSGAPKPSRPISMAPSADIVVGNYGVPKTTAKVEPPALPSLRPRPAAAAAAPAHAPAPAPVAPTQALTGIKVKVYQGADKRKIVALMVDPSITFKELKDRVTKKLGSSPQSLQYKDEDGDLVTMSSNDDVIVALEMHAQKLLLFTK